MTNFDSIRQEGWLLYEYVRGSHLYGLNTPQSDVDTSGVFICRPDDLLGLFRYKAQVSDERHDNIWFEIGELIRLVMKSNPTLLESLFVPDEMIIGEVSPVLRLVLEHREKFISKQTGYTSHCRQYHDCQEWARMRNQVRLSQTLTRTTTPRI